jgi:hypothetical protein
VDDRQAVAARRALTRPANLRGSAPLRVETGKQRSLGIIK